MTKKQKKVLVRIIVAAVLLIILHFVPLEGMWLGLLYLIPYAVIGYDILRKAVLGIMHGEVFDENFLMAVATVGAIAIAFYEKSGNFNEAVAVMLFYQVGELFQSYAVNRSRQSITDLMDICPEYANIEEDGQLKQVDPDDVEVGDIIVTSGIGGVFPKGLPLGTVSSVEKSANDVYYTIVVRAQTTAENNEEVLVITSLTDEQSASDEDVSTANSTPQGTLRDAATKTKDESSDDSSDTSETTDSGSSE